jgi:hypothetical protein
VVEVSPLKGTRKGPSFEQKVADFVGTERRRLRGILDRGDLVLKKWVAEVKCPGRDRPINLSAAMTEAKREAANAGVDRYCVITRRTGYPIEEAFFTIPLWMAREMGIPE